MRQIPISGRNPGSYFKGLLYIVTDLWAYLWTDIMVAYAWVKDEGYLGGVFEAVGKFAERSKESSSKLLLAIAVALVLAIVAIVLAAITTVIHTIWFSLLVIVGLRHFVPADEMIKAEMEKINRER